MPYSRQLPRIKPTARVSVRLTTSQRDLLVEAPGTPRDLGHLLHRAAVRDGKLSVQLNRTEIEKLVAAAARLAPVDRRGQRDLDALLRYLESLEDRFVREDDESSG